MNRSTCGAAVSCGVTAPHRGCGGAVCPVGGHGTHRSGGRAGTAIVREGNPPHPLDLDPTRLSDLLDVVVELLRTRTKASR